MGKKVSIDQDILNSMVTYIKMVSKLPDLNYGNMNLGERIIGYLRKYNEKFQEYLVSKSYDFESMGRDALTTLGFMEVTTVNDIKILAVPLYLLNVIPNGTKLISVLGDEITIGESVLDTNTMQGCVAYGFPIERIDRKYEEKMTKQAISEYPWITTNKEE